MANITPYKRAQYPTIEGNDRVYFDNEFRKIEETLRGVLSALGAAQVTGTIATGAASVETSNALLRILELDTQAAAASDDLDTVSGGKAGQLLVIKAASSSRTVVCKDGTGNLKLAGDMTLDNVEDSITLYNIAGTTWYELARSNNGA